MLHVIELIDRTKLNKYAVQSHELTQTLFYVNRTLSYTNPKFDFGKPNISIHKDHRVSVRVFEHVIKQWNELKWKDLSERKCARSRVPLRLRK